MKNVEKKGLNYSIFRKSKKRSYTIYVDTLIKYSDNLKKKTINKIKENIKNGLKEMKYRNI